MESSKKHIDEQMRQHLSGLEVGYDPSTWDKLAHRMDFEAQESVDDLFKNRLGGVEAPIAAGSWAAFEQLIEADEAVSSIEEETQLDNAAYEKLNNLRVPYREDHWALMAKRLEEEFSIRHILYRYKVAEITLMALLLLTVVRFMPMMEGWMQADTPTSVQIPVLDQPTQPTNEAQIQAIPVREMKIMKYMERR